MLAALVFIPLFDLASNYYARDHIVSSDECAIQQRSDSDNTPVITCPRDFDLMEDTLAQWLMAVFSVAAVGVSIWAVRLVNATLTTNRTANKIAKSVGRKQVRAYIAICDVRLHEADEGYASKIIVSYENFGQTPAKNVRSSTRFTFDMAGKGSTKESAPIRESGFPVAPGQKRYTSILLDTFAVMFIEMARKSAAVLYVHGRIDYDDVFGKPRYTTFKGHVKFDAGGDKTKHGFVISDDGNDAT